MKLLSSSLIATLALAALSFAGQTARAEGDAGCGLGSLIITDNTKVMQVLAATTNGIGVQTFAISTGTSNCRSQNWVLNEKAIQYFTEANQQDLSREMAQGEGEKLKTLASLYGCKGEAQNSFAKMAQGSLGSIVPAPETSSVEMVKNLNAAFSSHADVANACNAI